MGNKILKPRNLRRALQRVREKDGAGAHARASTQPRHEPRQSADQPADNPWARAVETDRALRDKPWGAEDNPEWAEKGLYLTRQSYADGWARIARDQSEWAGLPVPIMGERLTIAPGYYGADKQEELNRITNPAPASLHVCRDEDVDELVSLRNSFWSARLRATVNIWQEGKKFSYVVYHGINRSDCDIRTLGCAEAWSLETELRALEYLRGLVTHQAFRQYLLTGSFIETSKRSKISYMFRRLRPTLAISGSTGRLRILACLCLHPLAYYQNSWAGAMCPSDDVVGHLMLMRGDERLYWRRSNQHPPDRKEAGL